MSDIRNFKNHEIRYHEELYNNLYLLKQIYQTTPEFDRVFKKDMFVKKNKAAFYEIVYYLLNTLNPQLTQERLTTWPPFDIKGENKFRSQVLKYINELNTLYKHAGIPRIMSSHLISPGGNRFAKYMLKLSQLVIYEHLKKRCDDELLYCPESNKNVNNLTTITSHGESETREKLDLFNEYHKSMQGKALSLLDILRQLDQNISASKKEQAKAEEEFYKKYTVYPSEDSLKNKLTTLNEQWQSLTQIHTLYEDCKSLLDYISDTNLVIDLDKTEKQVKNLSSSEQDLPELFNTLTSLINSKSIQLPNPDSCYILQNSKKICELTDKYAVILKEMLVNKQQTQFLMKEVLETSKIVEFLTINQPKIDVHVSVDMQGIKPLEGSCSEFC